MGGPKPSGLPSPLPKVHKDDEAGRVGALFNPLGGGKGDRVIGVLTGEWAWGGHTPFHPPWGGGHPNPRRMSVMGVRGDGYKGYKG